MQSNLNKLKKKNPEMNFYLYDDKDCREFIKSNFCKRVLYDMIN